MNRKFVFLAVAAALVLFFRLDLHACAVCLTGASTDDPVTNAFNWSVMFLIIMPYTVVGSIAGWLFYSHWRAAKNHGGLRRRAPILRLAWINKGSGR